MGPVGVEDLAVEGLQPSVRLLGRRLVLPLVSAAAEGVEGLGFLRGTGGVLPRLVVELRGARPVPVAELAHLGLLHLRREGRPGFLQAQGLDRRKTQHPRGIDGEDPGDLGETGVLARVHAALLHVRAEELGAALDQAIEGVLHEDRLGAQFAAHALADVAQGAHAQKGEQGGWQQNGQGIEDYPANSKARHEG